MKKKNALAIPKSVKLLDLSYYLARVYREHESCEDPIFIGELGMLLFSKFLGQHPPFDGTYRSQAYAFLEYVDAGIHEWLEKHDLYPMYHALGDARIYADMLRSLAYQMQLAALPEQRKTAFVA
ncbi:MAG: hypothetical protein ABA06_04210 [Parcubacteria bacterium C7867-001]|nr:MAG: hypothetical protein ABA06_04210 [Parcubacteria bacterium C7867-001]